MRGKSCWGVRVGEMWGEVQREVHISYIKPLDWNDPLNLLVLKFGTQFP